MLEEEGKGSCNDGSLCVHQMMRREAAGITEAESTVGSKAMICSRLMFGKDSSPVDISKELVNYAEAFAL